MPQDSKGSFEEAVAREYDRLLRSVATGAATELGNRPDTVTLSPDDEAARWNYRNPDVTPDQLPILATEIMTRITQAYQEAQKPLPDPETLTRLVAAQVTRVQTKGLRRELVSRGFPEPKDQVKRAASLRKRYEAEQAALTGAGPQVQPDKAVGAEYTPAPGMAPPLEPEQSIADPMAPPAPQALPPAVQALTGGGM